MTESSKRTTADPRQAAYDAVYKVIGQARHGAADNAFAWRCVHAALDEMERHLGGGRQGS